MSCRLATWSQVVEPGATGAEAFPVGVGMEVKAYEQPSAGTGHHHGIAVARPVRFDESADEP